MNTAVARRLALGDRIVWVGKNDYQPSGPGTITRIPERCVRIFRLKSPGPSKRRLLEAPLLAREVKRATGDVTEFKNGASLEIATNDARLVRGRSAIAVLGSETCHWRTDEHSASSDEEVVGAAEPSMAMCADGGLLLLGSSVHRKKGYMYRQFCRLHGNDDAETLCWFAPSPVMNPKLPAHVIDRALAEDPHKARAEYLNFWREDLAEFLPLDVVEACTDWGVHERAPQPGIKYRASTDAASGTGKDAFALAITHCEPGGSVVHDVVRERKPRFVPASNKTLQPRTSFSAVQESVHGTKQT